MTGWMLMPEEWSAVRLSLLVAGACVAVTLVPGILVAWLLAPLLTMPPLTYGVLYLALTPVVASRQRERVTARLAVGVGAVRAVAEERDRVGDGRGGLGPIGARRL